MCVSGANGAKEGKKRKKNETRGKVLLFEKVSEKIIN